MEHDLAVRAPEPRERPYDAIIIGSGMSGLASAVILAKEGMRVLVLERHYRPGGYLHRFFRRGGAGFDVGFHYLGAIEAHQVLGTYLDYCGVLDRLTLIPFDHDGYDDMVFPDRRFLVPAGEQRFRERLIDAFPSERAGIESYFENHPGICDSFGFYRVRADQDMVKADRWMSTPLGSYLDGLAHDRTLRAILSGQNALYGVEPHRTPVGLHTLVTDTFMQGPYTIKGGGDALVQIMAARLRELGGELRTRATVAEILVDEKRAVCGVRTEGGDTYRAPLVISCAHPKATVRMLPESVLRPGYTKRILSMEDGIGTLSIFLTTKVDLSAYRGRNLYNFKTVDIDSLYADRLNEHGARFVFATVPTAREGRTSGGLHQVVALGFMSWEQVLPWVQTTTGKRGPDYEAFKQKAAEELADLVYELIPELEGHVESMEAATPLTNRDFAASEAGAAYGIHHSVEQSGRYGLRPSTRVQGLYLTGQSVLMPGVCGVTISAFHTCSFIVGADYLLGKVHARS